MMEYVRAVKNLLAINIILLVMIKKAPNERPTEARFTLVS